MDKDWALVVGIDTYPSAGVDPLKGAVHDAQMFHDWVTDAQGGNVPVNQVKLLTAALLGGPAAPGASALPRPVFSDIYEFFEELLSQLGTGRGQRLYLYLSGHGISPTGQESVRNAALLLANAQSPNRWHNFPGNLWAEGARSTALFREVVLIMDCCRDLKNNATVTAHPFGDPVGDSKDCRLIEAYATGWDSKARELLLPPAYRNEILESTQGVFTHALLKVLWSGKMTGTLLKESVNKCLELLLRNAKKTQKPEITPDEDLAKIVFNENAKPPSSAVTITGHSATAPVIEYYPLGSDITKQAVLQDWSYDGSAWRGNLETGQYELRLAQGGRRLKVFAGIPEEVVV